MHVTEMLNAIKCVHVCVYLCMLLQLDVWIWGDSGLHR